MILKLNKLKNINLFNFIAIFKNGYLIQIKKTIGK
jgi:hypothetical protein